MNPDSEISHLIDLMPASGRMYCRIVDRPQQRTPIAAKFPLPWEQIRPILINFDLWGQIAQPQRDLLLLRTVTWLLAPRWFQVSWSQGIVAIGVAATLVEVVQADPVGIVAAGGLTALAGTQIWRRGRSSQVELTADEAAIQVAQRRGYAESEAARHLLGAIEAVAQIEGRPLNFTELLRSQNLKAIAGLTAAGIPDKVRKES